MLGFFFMVFILGLALDVFGQTVSTIYDSNGAYKGMIITAPTPPSER